MRDHTTPIFKELTAQGAESVSVTPGAATVQAQFPISGLPPVTDDQLNYLNGFHLHVQFVFDPDAAGSAVSFDQLYKGLQSAQLSSPFFGDVYNSQHTRGAVLGHIIQVLAGGYAYPQPARAQIPASTDTDVTVDLFFFLPLSFEVFKKPHETAQWTGFFDGGMLTATLDAATVFEGDYAGAVTKTGVVRAVAEYVPSPDRFLGVPFQWRERQVTGGGSSPILRSVGFDTALQGVEAGAGLVFLAWLSDAAGIGMGGPDGVDNITNVEIPFRSQGLLRNVDPYFTVQRRLTKHRVGPISGGGAAGAAAHDGAGWPFTMAATPNGRPGAQATAMFWPIVAPGQDFETSKAQRLLGDHAINMSTTAPVSATHRFVSFELMEWTQAKVGQAMVGMLGSSAGAYRPNRKALGDSYVSDVSKLRYTRWIFEPR